MTVEPPFFPETDPPPRPPGFWFAAGVMAGGAVTALSMLTCFYLWG